MPPTNDGTTPKVAYGETSDSEVFAYRFGTVINIVNGGLECNKAAAYHGGPNQRASYYNSFAAYFNNKYKVNAVRMLAATNRYEGRVTSSDSTMIKSATCYNQKSYYGW